jgi:hypothetical protein
VAANAKPSASASIAASPLQTPTSGPAEASVIIVNETTFAVRVNVDGSSTTVAAHATSAPMYFLPSDTNNDNYQMVSVPNPTCGMSDDGGYNLSAPHRYRMSITDGGVWLHRQDDRGRTDAAGRSLHPDQLAGSSRGLSDIARRS